MQRFYINSDLLEKMQLELPKDILRHILVLRLKEGDSIILFNGSGREYQARLTLLNKTAAIAEIHQQRGSCKPSKLALDLLVCIIANDKMDLAIQKATELGVRSIIPIISERSQKLIAEKTSKRIEHWQKIVISSCEQCRNNVLPEIKVPIELNKILAIPYSGLRLVLSPQCEENTLPDNQNNAIQLLIGPEGGFSVAEMDKIKGFGFTSVQLGNLVLRSETAVIAGLTYAQLKFGGWE